MKYNTHNEILEGYKVESIDDVIEFVNGYVFSEDQTTQQEIKNAEYKATESGVDIYYDFGADYYFFVNAD